MKSITSEIIDETINRSYENIREDFFNDFWIKPQANFQPIFSYLGKWR